MVPGSLYPGADMVESIRAGLGGDAICTKWSKPKNYNNSNFIVEKKIKKRCFSGSKTIYFKIIYSKFGVRDLGVFDFDIDG